ncbi:unnamed protein product [Pocillopora meandrina]|uniref:Uncharacterized protein n=1 Tax=Pocillopora meandrina TaxID=46732 RepID=A0AAU9XG76_9CNID|nr:unnamed protein product [Pocillopora meandrina]
MSFFKKMRGKSRGKNHQELQFRASVPSPTVECAKDKCLPDKKDTIREESRRLSRPRSLKSFRKEKRHGDVTSAAACSNVATTKINAAPLAPLSGVVGNHEKKKEAKAGADTKGNSSQAVSCRGRNKTRSGPRKVKRKAPPPPMPLSERPSVSHTSPSQSGLPRPVSARPSPPIPPPRQPPTCKAASPRPPPPNMKQPGKKSDTTSVKKKENEMRHYPKDLNPFANSNGTTDNDFSSQNSGKASSARRQRHKRRRKNSKSGEYPMENNPFNDTDEMSETPSSTRRQRRRRKRRESMNEEHKMEDISSSDADDIRIKPSSIRGQRRRTKRKESNGEKYKMEHNPSNDTDEENSSTILQSTNTSDMWSISSLEDIQFVVNTATVEEVNVKTAFQGLAASDEKDEQVDREDYGDSKAQSFPSDKEVSPDDLPSTNKYNVPAIIGSTNLDASTAKDFSNASERSTINQAQLTEEVIAMEDCQGGDSFVAIVSNQFPKLAFYVETEIQVVEHELLSLHKVMVKLELEMKEAIDTEDCEAEFESLSLDSLALNKFRSEVDERKQDLLTLLEENQRTQRSGKECPGSYLQVDQHGLNNKLH